MTTALSSLLPSAQVNLTAGPSLPGELVGSAALKLITVLQEEANSPDAVKAAQAKDRLAQWDELATAQQNNDVETERKFIERRMAALAA